MEAVVTDHYPTARSEAVALAATLRRKGFHTEPPASHHELWAGGRYTWVHSDRSLGQLAVARLFRHEALNYEREPFRLVSIVSPKRGAPILLVAVGEGARGDHHISLLRSEGRGLGLRPYSMLDLRGLIAGGWRTGMKKLGRPLNHPILKPLGGFDSASGAADSEVA